MNVWQFYLFLLASGVKRLPDGSHLAFSSVERFLASVFPAPGRPTNEEGRELI